MKQTCEAHSQGGFSRCGRTPLSNKRSTILFEENTKLLKSPLFVEKVHNFVQKNHPVEVSGYGPEISKDILFIYHDKEIYFRRKR